MCVFPVSFLDVWADHRILIFFDHLLKCYFTVEKPFQKLVLLETEHVVLLNSNLNRHALRKIP